MDNLIAANNHNLRSQQSFTTNVVVAVAIMLCQQQVSAFEASIPHTHFSGESLPIEMPTKLIFPKIDFPRIEARDTNDPTVQDLIHFTAKGINFVGNTVFKDDELRLLVSHFLDTPINTFDLEELRLIITKYYFNHGYVNSGALFPDQLFENDVLIIHITEGRLTRYNVTNNGRLGPAFIEKRLSFNNETLLHISELQNKLFLLQKDPHIEKVEASLRSTILRGQSILDIDVTERKPYTLTAEFNNHGDPNIGEEQLVLDASNINVSGKGDTINLKLSKTEGADETKINYQWPLNPQDDRLNFELKFFSTDVIHDSLNAGSDGYSAAVSFARPLHRSLYEEYWAEIKLNKHYTETYNKSGNTLSGDCPKSECNIAALRLTQYWQKRTHVNKYEFKHTISHGMSKLGGSDSFTSWRLKYQLSKRYPQKNIVSIFRIGAQTTQSQLLPAEKFIVSGFNNVRGYSESHLTTDSGVTLTLEGRLPFWQGKWQDNTFNLIAFYDCGQGWNSDAISNKQTIKSIGFGINWKYMRRYTTKIYWADTRSDIIESMNTLQGDGVYLSVSADIL